MTHYSTEENHVRIDIFKPSGKWVETLAVPWIGYDGNIYVEFRLTLNSIGGYTGMTAVCLAPYNESAFPLMTVI